MADNRQRGMIRIASEIESRGGGVETAARAIAAGTGVEEVTDRAAAEFSRIGNQIGQWADHAAAVEGREAGSLAGLDPEFRPSRSLTIRGEAFDKAGLDVWGSRHKTAMLDDVEALHARHPSDPDALAAGIDKKRQAWLAKVPTPLVAEMTLSFDRARTTAVRAASRQRLAEFQAEQRAAAVDDMTASMKRLHQEAYNLGLDATADEHMRGGLDEIGKLTSRRDVTGKPLFSPSQARKVLEDARETVAQARLLGAVERTPTVEGKREILERFKAEFGKSEGLGGLFGLEKFRAVEHMLEAQVRHAEVTAHAAVKLVEEDVKRFAGMAEKGQMLRPDDLTALRTKVETHAPQLGGHLAAAEANLQYVQAARTKPTDEFAAELRAERARLSAAGGALKEKGDAAGWARLELGEKILAEQRSELKKDQIAYFAKAFPGLIKPIDFTDDATVEASLRDRVAVAQGLAERQGVEVRYFSDEEGAWLATHAAKGGETLIKVATVVARSGEAAPRIMAELGKHGPATAFVGGMVLANGVTPAADDAAKGFGLMKLEDFKSRLPKHADIEDAAATIIGRALDGLDANKSAVVQVASAIYEARAQRSGKRDDIELWKDALRAALGEQTIGGVPFGGIATRPSYWGRTFDTVVVPPWLMKHGLTDALNGLTEADITAGLGAMPVTDKGKALPMASIRAARMVAIGSGRYWLAASADPDEPQYLGGDGPHGRFVLDLNKLRPAIAKHDPDLVAGGR